MSIQVEYVDDGKGVLWKATGTVTGEDLLLANKTTFSRDISVQPYNYGLFDATAMTGINISAEDMRKNAIEDASTARQMPNFVFAVHVNDDASYGMARMWEGLIQGSGWETRVFRDRSQAVEWLRASVATKFGYKIGLE